LAESDSVRVVEEPDVIGTHSTLTITLGGRFCYYPYVMNEKTGVHRH
jgi:hypothetical protein